MNNEERQFAFLLKAEHYATRYRETVGTSVLNGNADMATTSSHAQEREPEEV